MEEQAKKLLRTDAGPGRRKRLRKDDNGPYAAAAV